MPALSVVICTYNPRQDYLDRTLNALRAQTLPKTDWELLIIDNASTPPVAGRVDLAWHPNAKIIVEAELGIASARLRAMKEYSGDLLVFLDDDNVLAEDYLDRCLKLFATRPDLGAVSGCIMPEYESPPPDWFGPYESWIAVRRVTESAWSNFVDSRSEPVTAGMCLRRSVTAAHVKDAKENPTLPILGSKGNSLLRGEDVTIVKAAMKLGYSVGQFAELKMVHLIPKRRVEPQYLLALYRHLCASGYLISWVDHAGRQPIRYPWRKSLRSAFYLVRGSQIRRRLVVEEFRGYRLAKKLVKEWSATKNAGNS